MAKIPESMIPQGPDLVYEELRADWHVKRKLWLNDGGADSGQAWRAFNFVDRKLSDYLWDKTQREIAEDRRKHPKAKRNAPVPKKEAGEPSPGERALP